MLRRRAVPLLLGLAGWLAAFPAAAEQTVVDAAGRRIAVPDRVERVATIGSVPVLNSFVMAVGKAGTIVNSLPPPWSNRERYKFHAILAPGLAGRPVIQDPNRVPDLEAIITLQPQIVFTTYRSTVDALEPRGIPVALIEWRRPQDIEACVTLIAAVLGVPDAAERYMAFLGSTVERVRARMEPVPEMDRPTVLYIDPETMTQPHLIAEWWIEAAGGRSVTKDGRSIEVLGFSLEQAVAWDPDVMIVASPSQKEKLLRHAILGRLKAARAGRVLVVPTAAHTWGNRTAEQPLTVLWAAKNLNPDRFRDLDLAAETAAFYAAFFGANLGVDQVAEILGDAVPKTPR